MNFKSESDYRVFALNNLLKRLEEEIILNSDLTNKAFRIYETKVFDEVRGKEITRFTINEIPVTIEHLKLPSLECILKKKKNNFKTKNKIFI